LADPDHLAKLEEGVDAWNKWRKDNPDIRPDLSNTNLSKVNLSGVNLSMADLIKANLSRAKLSGADMSGADMRGTDLSQADLRGSDLRNANMRGANTSMAKLIEADLSQADLSQANMSRANLSRANISRANMSRANTSMANLSDAKLRVADLSRANMSGANMSGANTSMANMRGANLSRANMRGANLSRANMRGAKLIETQLMQTNFTEANLSEADITGALWYQVFTVAWKIKGIKTEYLYYTDNREVKEEHKKTFAPGEFEKIHTVMEDIFDIVLNVPLTESSSFLGEVIARSINHLEGSPVIGLRVVDPAGVIKALSDTDGGLPDPVEELTDGVLTPRPLPIPFLPYQIEPQALQEKAVEFYIKRGKAAEFVLNVIKTHFR
jgi:uncharacterized protein YjbI with pentapeptide repeats